MKIGICGAHSVGKTTLLSALRSEPGFKNYTICDEVTRTVKSYGLPINESGTGVTQRLIAQQHLVNVVLNDSLITDRTILDCLIYSQWLYNQGKITASDLEYVNKIFDIVFLQYDVILYIRPEFDIVGDGVRSTDEVWRDQISNLFEDWMSNYKDNVPTIIGVTGTVVQRVQQVKEIVFGDSSDE